MAEATTAERENREPPRWLRGSAPAWLLTLTSVPLLFYGLGSYSLVHGDEGVYHGIAREMAASVDWLRLTLHGEPRVYDTLMNAPLQYWARAAVILAFGDNYWTMRALSALAALAAVLSTYRLAKGIGGARAGLLAGLFLLGNYQFVYLHGARIGALEPAVCWCLTAIAQRFLLAAQGRAGFAMHHAIVALLAQVKAPLVLVPLAAEIALFASVPALRPRLRNWLRWLPLVCAGFAWHAFQLIELRNTGGDALLSMLTKAAGTGAKNQLELGARVDFYARVLCYGAFPQVLLWPFALSSARRAGVHFDPRALGILAALPLGIAAFYLSIQTAYDWYVLPLQPFAAVWLALFCERELRAPTRASALALGIAVAGIALIAVHDANPFARHPSLGAGVIGWRSDVGTMLGAAIAGGLAISAARAIGARTSVRARRALPRALVSLVLAASLLRVITPLRQVDTVSELESLAASLRAARARGETPAFPIAIREPGYSRANFYFGADYQIELARRDVAGIYFWLVGPRGSRSARSERSE
jgi:4-amino-4-deoxy-L-arabinose transferase-like glycosyltransferase